MAREPSGEDSKKQEHCAFVRELDQEEWVQPWEVQLGRAQELLG